GLASSPWNTIGCSFPTPECIFSYREEDPAALDLGNFQGEIPVPAHGSAVSYALLFEDISNDGADDRAYSLQLSYVAEGSDDASSYHADGTSAISVGTSLGSYSEDPGNAGAAQGYFGSGHGVNVRNQ